MQCPLVQSPKVRDEPRLGRLRWAKQRCEAASRLAPQYRPPPGKTRSARRHSCIITHPPTSKSELSSDLSRRPPPCRSFDHAAHCGDSLEAGEPVSSHPAIRCGLERFDDHHVPHEASRDSPLSPACGDVRLGDAADPSSPAELPAPTPAARVLPPHSDHFDMARKAGLERIGLTRRVQGGATADGLLPRKSSAFCPPGRRSPRARRSRIHPAPTAPRAAQPTHWGRPALPADGLRDAREGRLRRRRAPGLGGPSAGTTWDKRQGSRRT